MTSPKGEQFPRKAISVRAGKTEEEGGRNYAAMATSPELAAYRVIESAEKNSGIAEQLDVPTMLAHLREQSAAVNQGDLAHAEAMLMNQATALQSLFARLAERGMGCDQAPAFEANMKMALRAQSQCRATIETLSAIKNPPVVYARQANVTSGPQQINNSTPVQSRARGNKMSYYRTPEHRALRAKIIHRWKPWGKSTGPKSAEGKKKVSRNGYKGRERGLMREIRAALREQADIKESFNSVGTLME